MFQKPYSKITRIACIACITCITCLTHITILMPYTSHASLTTKVIHRPCMHRMYHMHYTQRRVHMHLSHHHTTARIIACPFSADAHLTARPGIELWTFVYTIYSISPCTTLPQPYLERVNWAIYMCISFRHTVQSVPVHNTFHVRMNFHEIKA